MAVGCKRTKSVVRNSRCLQHGKNLVHLYAGHAPRLHPNSLPALVAADDDEHYVYAIIL